MQSTFISTCVPQGHRDTDAARLWRTWLCVCGGGDAECKLQDQVIKRIPPRHHSPLARPALSSVPIVTLPFPPGAKRLRARRVSRYFISEWLLVSYTKQINEDLQYSTQWSLSHGTGGLLLEPHAQPFCLSHFSDKVLHFCLGWAWMMILPSTPPT
jgi:hypothetical protein